MQVTYMDSVGDLWAGVKDFKAIPGVDFVKQGLSLSVFVQVLSTHSGI